MCIGHCHSLIKSQGHRSRTKVNAKMCVLHEYLLRRPMGMALVVGFHCDVISRELARRGVRRGAGSASGSGGV